MATKRVVEAVAKAYAGHLYDLNLQAWRDESARLLNRLERCGFRVVEKPVTPKRPSAKRKR